MKVLRLVGRMVRVGLVAFVMLAGSAQPASAQFIEFMEWLDRLSGPGPFDLNPIGVPSVSIPVGCVTRVTTKDGATIQAVRDAFATRAPVAGAPRIAAPDQTTAWNALRLQPEVNRYRLELGGCFGVVAAANSGDATRPAWGT